MAARGCGGCAAGLVGASAAFSNAAVVKTVTAAGWEARSRLPMEVAADALPAIFADGAVAPVRAMFLPPELPVVLRAGRRPYLPDRVADGHRDAGRRAPVGGLASRSLPPVLQQRPLVGGRARAAVGGADRRAIL